MSKHSEMHAAIELVLELEAMGVARRHAVIQAADEWGFKEYDVEMQLAKQEIDEGSMTRYDLDFETTLSDGRLVHIVASADILSRCDCGDEPHNHVVDIHIESITQLFEAGTVEGGDITVNSKEMVEIAQLIEDETYSTLSVA